MTDGIDPTDDRGPTVMLGTVILLVAFKAGIVVGWLLRGWVS